MTAIKTSDSVDQMQTFHPMTDTDRTDSPADPVEAIRRSYAEFDALVKGIGSRPLADPALSARAATVLSRESRLLDHRRYEEWLDTWTPDGLWWIPIDHTRPDAAAQSLALDDVRRLRERIGWIGDPSAWSQQPPTRVLRSVGSVEAWLDGPDRLVTSSAVTITTVRRGIVRTTAAHQVHEFDVGDADHDDGLIRRKAILLIDSDLSQPNPGYLL